MILCKHWEEPGRCAAGLYGGKPSIGVCGACPHKQKGLGDIVATVAEPLRKLFKIPKCGKCGQRRQALNKLSKSNK